FGTVLRNEITEKGVAGADGEKAKGDAGACVCAGMGEDTVEDLVGGAVAAYGDEAALILLVSLASEIGGVTRAGGSDYVNVEAVLAQAPDRGASQLGGAAAARGGVDDGEKGFSHAIRRLPKKGLEFSSGLKPIARYL